VHVHERAIDDGLARLRVDHRLQQLLVRLARSWRRWESTSRPACAVRPLPFMSGRHAEASGLLQRLTAIAVCRRREDALIPRFCVQYYTDHLDGLFRERYPDMGKSPRAVAISPTAPPGS
jgi:hypothetical protein